MALSAANPIGFQTCNKISDGSATGNVVTWRPPRAVQAGQAAAPPVPVPDVGAAVAQAEAQLQLALPEVATSPPRGGQQLVGVPVWFWVTDTQPVQTTATIPGLSATLTATPAGTSIAIGGGDGPAVADNVTLDCPGGGTPWVEGGGDPWADSDCSHVFDWNDTYTIDATVNWTLAWTATNGQSGTLPPVGRTTTFTLTIQEAQAVTD